MVKLVALLLVLAAVATARSPLRRINGQTKLKQIEERPERANRTTEPEVTSSELIWNGEAMTWLEAEAFCASIGATLASVPSESRNQELMDFARANGYTHGLSQFWIGGSDQYLEGEFAWIDGSGVFWKQGATEAEDQSLMFTAWGRGQPNNLFMFGQHCVEMYDGTRLGEDGPKWNDDMCTSMSRQPSICARRRRARQAGGRDARLTE